jgi:hypothetical protein
MNIGHGQPVTRIIGALAANGERMGFTRWERAQLQMIYDPAEPFQFSIAIEEGPWPMDAFPISREMVMETMRVRADRWVGLDMYWVRSLRGGAVEFAFEDLRYRVRPIAWQFSAFLLATQRSVPEGFEQIHGLDAFLEGLLSQ